MRWYLSSSKTVIVVLNWNGKEDTLACLHSLAQVETPEHEVLVVDNGSEDGSEEAIRAAFPEVPVLQTGSNLGFAGGNNAGIDWALAHGAGYVLLLNNDTLVEPDFLTHMVATAESGPRVGIVGASIAYAASPQKLWAFGGGRFDIATGWVRHLSHPVPSSELRPRGYRHFYITGCTMLLRRSLLEEVGVLETSYFHFCEDVDLCLRSEKAGYELAVAQEARILHKVSATTRISSPLFLYYNLRSRLSLVRRHGPPGAPSRRAVVILWLRLWRPAVFSGMPLSGWKALEVAHEDWRQEKEGPAPMEAFSRGSRGRLLALLLLLVIVGGFFAAGQRWIVSHTGSRPRSGQEVLGEEPAYRDLRSVFAALWEKEDSLPPEDLLHALYAMAVDATLSGRVLGRADRRCRRLTHRLVTLLDLSDQQARDHIAGLYEVHDLGPPPGQRPPTWSDLRRQGVLLLQAIAPAADQGRDRRLLQEIARDELSRTPGYPRASVVAARVGLWKKWWLDRGLDKHFWFDPSLRPDSTPWLKALHASSAQGGQPLDALLLEMTDRPLALRALLAQLNPGRDGALVSECVRIAMLYQVDFDERGFPHRSWDAKAGRMTGHSASEYRAVALVIFHRVCPFLPSGADEGEVIKSIAYWWKGARFQARYYRDPLKAPTLEPWLGGLDRPEEEGGVPIARFLRECYVADGFRELLLDQLDTGHEVLVAELVPWLGYDQQQASAKGFVMGYRRMPLRPMPGERGRMVGIPWPRVQELIREMLHRITGDAGLPEQGVDETTRNQFWLDWWRAHASQARWYRSGVPAAAPPRFEMKRASDQ